MIKKNIIEKKKDIFNINNNFKNNNSNINLNNQFSSKVLFNELNYVDNIINNNKKQSLLIEREDFNNNKDNVKQIDSKFRNKSELKVFDLNNNKENFNYEKFQELIESKKIINTLNSIKTSTSINMNYEEIKLLPDLFLDMQEALKKSNQNVLELKETIKEKIILEKKLKQKIKYYENENKKLNEKIYFYQTKENKLTEENYKLKINSSNLNNNKYDEIKKDNEKLSKLNSELLMKIDKLEIKNKKYKENFGKLKAELNNISDKNEKNNYSYMNNIKDMKTELKNQLIEKMNLLMEINNLDNALSKLKEENLKLEEDLKQNIKIKDKFEKLLYEYKKMNQDNEELNTELNI